MMLNASGVASVSQGYSLNQDSDRDGLIDAQEAYWGTDPHNPDTDGDGYVDGEEVVSGHDPLKKGPNDLLNAAANLTDQASSLLIGGVIAGSLQPGTPDYSQAVQTLVSNVFDQYKANTAFTVDSFKQGNDTRSAIIAYGFTMSRLMQSTFTGTTTGYSSVLEVIQNVPVDQLGTLVKDDPTTYQAFINAVTAEVKALDNRIASVKAIAVPPSMQDAHRNVLLLLRGVQQQYTTVRAIARDPLQGLLAFQVLNSLITRSTLEITQDFSGRLSQALASHP